MRAVVYARVSTARQAENDLSIPDQVNQMKSWCLSNGHAVVREYIEPGATGTDDKRRVFQNMITDAQSKPSAFDLVIVHSMSRFYRDQIDYGVYERLLLKHGVRLIAITQLVSNDSAGFLTKGMINLFDAHLSGEISKHTSRGMKENARQGYFNGSRPPFGYKAVETDRAGTRGRMRKRLFIDDDEAPTVSLIYDLYMNGYKGKDLGCKEIAKQLNSSGLMMRGKPWGIQKVHKILSNPLYMGDYYFFVINSKDKTRRPPEEWVKTQIPAIVDAAIFQRVTEKRKSRAPSSAPPRVTSSPTLLTGLLKCGECGHSLTITTGKGGRYKYYKCTNRQNKGNAACGSGNIPMGMLDQLVLNQLASKVFTPERLQSMVEGLRKRMAQDQGAQQDQINLLLRQLKLLDERQNRLLEAIETGTIDLDELTQKRAQQIKVAREALVIQLAEVRRSPRMPEGQLRASQTTRFGDALRKRLLSGDPEFAKPYLRALVSEIVVDGRSATIRGSHAALASAIATQKKEGTQNQVPTFIGVWCARRDSNSLPLGS